MSSIECWNVASESVVAFGEPGTVNMQVIAHVYSFKVALHCSCYRHFFERLTLSHKKDRYFVSGCMGGEKETCWSSKLTICLVNR